MGGWDRNQIVRVGVASFAAVAAASVVALPGTAQAAAVGQNPSPGAANPRPPARDVPDARYKTTPGQAGPNNAAPPQAPQASQPAPAAPAPPAPRPRQRKDRPPDRDPHKFSPKQRTPDQRTTRRDNDNDNDRRRSNRKREERKDATAPEPGAGAPQIPTPEGVITGVNEILKRLSGQRKTKTGKTVFPLPGMPRREIRCGPGGCLIITPAEEKPKPKKKKRPKVEAKDNRRVVEKAEEEARNWKEKGPDTPNKYSEWFQGGPDDFADWCARFVSYIYAQAGYPLPDMQTWGGDLSPTGFQYVPAGEDAARRLGMWHDGAEGIQPGDIVIYTWQHTGVATSHQNPDGTVDVIEGNTSAGEYSDDQVAKHRRGGSLIKGYIRPPTNSNPLPGHLRSRPGGLLRFGG